MFRKIILSIFVLSITIEYTNFITFELNKLIYKENLEKKPMIFNINITDKKKVNNDLPNLSSEFSLRYKFVLPKIRVSSLVLSKPSLTNYNSNLYFDERVSFYRYKFYRNIEYIKFGYMGKLKSDKKYLFTDLSPPF